MSHANIENGSIPFKVDLAEAWISSGLDNSWLVFCGLGVGALAARRYEENEIFLDYSTIAMSDDICPCLIETFGDIH